MSVLAKHPYVHEQSSKDLTSKVGVRDTEWVTAVVPGRGRTEVATTEHDNEASGPA